MKIFFERRFLKDVECINEKSVRQQIENIISEIETTQQLSTVQHIKKIKGHESAYRIRIGHYSLGLFTKIILQYFPVFSTEKTFINTFHKSD